MATQDYRYSFRMTDEMKVRLTKFWHEHELKNIGVAISQLIDIGFQALDDEKVVYTPKEERPAHQYEPSDEALQLAKDFDRLDLDYRVAVKSVVKAFLKEQSLRADNRRAENRE